MFVTADSLGWARHSTPQAVLCKLPWSPSTKAYQRLEGQKEGPIAHALQDYFGPSHQDTNHHISHKSCWSSRKTEGVKLLRGHLCRPPRSFPFPPTLGCIPQETQPGSARCLMESSTTRVARGMLSCVFCNTVKWMCQISQNWHPQPRSPNWI